ncbi:MAG: rRNA pseudouridine synthase [Planctomycetes bacterium]|nr:rRNA pseudouridine synthase [Planctomycetota bacterium]
MMRERKTLDRVLSRAGAMSRKQAELAIREGRVRVNGLRERDPATWVDLAQDRVSLDDRPLAEWKAVHLALHKPVGYVTTRSDEHGRATVYELLPDVEAWVAPIGRLDRDTSGLLLFTNDTELAEHVNNPASKLPKTYDCVAAGELDDQALERLRRGVPLDDGPTRPALVELFARGEGRTQLALTITEGRNRQVRRMLEALGSRVLSLQRTAIGPIRLGPLELGRHRKLSSREVRALYSR